MATKLFTITFLICVYLCPQVSCKSYNVIVVGGGMAGIAAARKLSQDKMSRYHVKIFEAKRDRYGGRLWTKRNLSANSKDIQCDLGASFINSQVKDNPLIALAKKFEIDLEALGQSQVVFSKSGKVIESIELSEAKRSAKELFLSAIEKAQNDRLDISVPEAVNREMLYQELREDSLIMDLIKMIPSYNNPDSSVLLYGPDRLDFGYDKFVKFGLSEILDRLVSGTEAEPPLDMNLRQVVRQIEVKKDENRVIVRSAVGPETGGTQISVDAVIIAVPLSVLKNNSILFDPPLPQEFYKIFNKINSRNSEKIVLEFDEVFWPENVGTFSLIPEKPEEIGILLSWTNLYKIMNKPYLAASVGHGAADRVLKMLAEDLTTLALERLSKLFGKDVIRHHNVTNILRSDWLTSLHNGGTSGYYVPVGNSADLWEIFNEPVCPGIYFAGDYTMLDGFGTLHGAYKSGVRAAEALMSGFCEKKAEEERKRKEEELRKAIEQNKTLSDDTDRPEDDSKSKDEL